MRNIDRKSKTGDASEIFNYRKYTEQLLYEQLQKTYKYVSEIRPYSYQK